MRCVYHTMAFVAVVTCCVSQASANLLENPGFELPDLIPPDNQAAGADDWVLFNTAGVRTIQQHSGDQSLRLAPNGPTGTGDGIARQEFAASANDLLSFGTWVLNPSSDPLTGSRKAQLRLQWLNSNDTLINQTILKVADETTPQDVWINFRLVDLELPDNSNITTVRPSLFVTNDGGTGGGVTFFDDVEFINHSAASAGGSSVEFIPEPSSLALLFAGAMAMACRRRQRRIAHHSGNSCFTLSKFSLIVLAGMLMAEQASANLLLNPGFELPEVPDGTFVVPGANDWVTFNTAGVTKSQSRPGSSGDQSLRLAPNAPTGFGTGIARQEFSAQANDSFSFSAWVYHPSNAPVTGPRTGQMRIQWLNSNDTLINQVILNVLDESTPQDQWIFVELENYQLPDNENIVTVRPSLFVNNNSSDVVSSGAVYFDDVTFLANTPGLVGDFDGDLDIDGADFLEWQAADGTAQGLSDWQANYPTSGPAPLIQSVPEPASASCLTLVVLIFASSTMRRTVGR